MKESLKGCVSAPDEHMLTSRVPHRAAVRRLGAQLFPVGGTSCPDPGLSVMLVLFPVGGTSVLILGSV